MKIPKQQVTVWWFVLSVLYVRCPAGGRTEEPSLPALGTFRNNIHREPRGLSRWKTLGWELSIEHT